MSEVRVVTPTWKKYNAASPQYADVGKALYDAYFNSYNYDDMHPKGWHSKRHMFDDHDLKMLLDYMQNEQKHYEGIIDDMQNLLTEIVSFCKEHFAECIAKLKQKPLWLKNDRKNK